MADVTKQILAKPILLTEQVMRAADEATNFKQDCAEIASKTEKLAALLLQAAHASSDPYERLTSIIMDDTQHVLERTLALLLKCQPNCIKQRIFPIVPAAAFRNMSSQLEDSIVNVSWLLRASTPSNNRAADYLGFPPMGFQDPIIFLIWKQIAILFTGSTEVRFDAADNLVLLAQDNDRTRRMIITEAGGSLLKLIEKGQVEDKENAARLIGFLSRDPTCAEHMVHVGVCSVFAKILEEGPMKVQVMVAWAVSELADNYSACQDIFAEHNIIRLLVKHLAFETIEEHRNYARTSKATTIHALGMASSITNNDIDSDNKANMKAMAARALWHLAKGSPTICRSITESRALLCFAVLLEKGPGEVKFNSAMSLTEITAVAEKDTDLRRSAFKPNSPACKALVDQVLKIIDKGESNLLIPCIKTIGYLARTFRATETRIIRPLVQLLHEREAEVSREASIALAKFATSENYLHIDHSKAIISAGGAKHLVQLVYFGDQMVKVPALVLLCYCAMHVPDSVELAHAQVLTMLEWASKQEFKVQDESLLQKAHARLFRATSNKVTDPLDLKFEIRKWILNNHTH